ncbi:MAG: hypothetical protein HOV81_14615 [Kofleriaceae bacterium]|nr:hypothetical protein [Kofleriaceae bacterium]
MSVAPDDDAAAPIDTGSAATVADDPTRYTAPAKPKVDDVAKPRRLSSGRHGTSIASVEISADGAGVVSLDAEAHARLWPALDGSREPLALPLTSPSKLVVHHDANGFAIASLDTGGGIEILDIDDADMLVKKTTLAAEPPYAYVVATGGGFLAMREDHQVEWIDRAGVRGASLTPPHGERLAGLFGMADRVLALVETRDGIHGQWIETTNGKLAWGPATPKLDLDPERTFMSPDGTHLIAMRAKRNEPAVFELATGATKSLKQRDPTAPPVFELEVPQRSMNRFGIDPPGTLLGFASNDRVVFSDVNVNGGPFAWYDLRGKTMAQMSPELSFMFATDFTAFGGGKAVSFMDRELVVVKPTKLDYIGYRTRTARGLHATSAGMVATVGGARLLDDRLRAGKRVESERLGVAENLELVSIGPPQRAKDQWLEKLEDDVLERRKIATRVALYDVAAKKVLQSWRIANRSKRVRYEPATKRMVIDHGKQLEVATFDPATRTFGPSTKIAVPPMTDVVLLDPAIASGDVAITVHGKELRRWRAEDLDAATAPAPIVLAATPEAIDRAGHVYIREKPDTVVISGPGRDIRVAELDGWKLRPNTDGTRIAAFRPSGIMLLDGDGRALWTIGMPGVANLAWTADGKLIAQARDLVELSTADGSIVYAQCGWTFARRSKPIEDFIPTDQTYCDR